MNTLIRTIALLTLGSVASAQPRDTVRVDMGHGSQMWIEGSSNVAGWRCKAAAFEARVEIDPAVAGRDNLAIALRTIDVKAAVRDLKCGNRRMDRDLYAALQASDSTKPAFILGRFEVIADSVEASRIATRGSLLVAGVERAVNVPVTTERGTDGLTRARGSVSMLMTDFGIKPPVGLFGLIRSRNEITVKFDLVVSPRTIVQR